VKIVHVDDDALTLRIDGEIAVAEWQKLSRRLAEAPAIARETIEISPAG